MPFYYNGESIGGPMGPSGPDGNPIGTIIIFMGTAAPKDYLVCDGAQHNISDYPELAAFFQTQFGTKNHFGGDGTTTFAVPDLRNLFLRGYHGEAEEQLSGEIGEKQEATAHNNIGVDTRFGVSNFVAYSDANSFLWAQNTDSDTPASMGYYFKSTSEFNAVSGEPNQYTSRPVNMAVLYCIKAVYSVPAENVYSTEETRIGTWIDGKPIYRQVVYFNSPKKRGNIEVYDFGGKIAVKRFEVFMDQLDARGFLNTVRTVPHESRLDSAFACDAFITDYEGGNTKIYMDNGSGDVVNGAPCYAIVEYTKTTD